MTKEDLFRLGCISIDATSSNLKGSIRRLVYSVFYETNNMQLTIPELITKIQDRYSLEFSSKELEESLDGDKNLDRYEDGEDSKFRLSIKKYEKISTTDNSYSLPQILKLYYEKNSIQKDITYIVELITNYIYQVFSKNINSLLSLINKDINSISYEDHEYDNDEKTIINDFLNWDNKDKDIAIYNTISYCVDYCMMTVKKDSNAFSSLFSGKKFYLDANVVLRLIGFNNLDRQQVLESFIKRCKACKIELIISNYTCLEANNTIDYYVSNLSSINKDNKPLSQKQYDRYVPNKKDIINLYNDWKKTAKQYNDYNAFAKYLRDKVNTVSASCSKATFANQDMINKVEYTDMYNSLKAFKESLNIPTYKSSLDVDINNFLNIKRLRDEEHGENIFNLNTYLITTDSKLCEWNKELYKGVTPICVLPSIWYSILLKTTGRTNDDYKAFTSFINMRYAIEPDENIKKKETIITLVQELKEPTYIKEQILDSIYVKISKLGFVYQPQQIVEDTEVEIENKTIGKITSIIGKQFLEEGELLGYQKIAEKKIDTRVKILKKTKRVIEFIPTILNIFICLFIVLLLVLYLINRTEYIKQFFADKQSLFDVLCKIRNIDGILSVAARILIQLFIKPIINSIDKKINNKDKMIEKKLHEIIKKYKNYTKENKQ